MEFITGLNEAAEAFAEQHLKRQLKQPIKIEVFYCWSENVWAFAHYDLEGNHMWESEYAHRKSDAIDLAIRARDEWKASGINIPVVIYKRDGNPHRVMAA